LALVSAVGSPRYLCSPQHDSAFYRIIGQMKRAAALARHDSTQLKLDKLDGVLSFIAQYLSPQTRTSIGLITNF
jgi:hypothetical protein